MDKLIEQVFKAFNHLVREIQIYLISGGMVILNIFVIDYYYFNNSLSQFISRKQYVLPWIIVAYVTGHICMAFFYTILEWKKLDKKLNKLLGFTHDIKSELLPKIYIKHQDAYRHFLERYVLLSMMRWNMSAAFFINFLINLYFIIFHQYVWQIGLLVGLCLLCSGCLYLLTGQTEKEYSDRINSMRFM